MALKIKEAITQIVEISAAEHDVTRVNSIQFLYKISLHFFIFVKFKFYFQTLCILLKKTFLYTRVNTTFFRAERIL